MSPWILTLVLIPTGCLFPLRLARQADILFRDHAQPDAIQVGLVSGDVDHRMTLQPLGRTVAFAMARYAGDTPLRVLDK
jgi:hypothetical protein